MMDLLMVAMMVLSLLPLPISIWLLRRERRPVKAFDDIVTHLAWPLLILPFVVDLPRTVLKVVLAVAAAIFIGRIVPLIRKSRALRRGRVDDAPDGR